jgi:hypothetical protein
MNSSRTRNAIVIGLVIVIGLLLAYIFANRDGDEPREQDAEQILVGSDIQNGIVYLDSDQISPPFTIVVESGDIRINNQVVHRMAQLPEGDVPLSQEPNDPKDIDELMAASGWWLFNNQADPASLAAYLSSFPSASEVSYTSNSVEITDTAGNMQGIIIDDNPSPTTQDLLEDQVEKAEHWAWLLDEGALLIIYSDGGSIEVPKSQSEEFLNENLSENILPDLDRSSSVEKLFATLPSASFSDTSIIFQNSADAIDQILGTGPHHFQSDTPNATAFHIFSVSPYDFNDPVKKAGVLHGYNVYVYEKGYFDAGTSTIENFFDTSNDAAVIYTKMHGNMRFLCFEQYYSNSTRNAVFDEYVSDEVRVSRHILRMTSWSSWNKYWDDYLICASSTYIRENWQSSETIVLNYSCEGFALSGAFRAREFIGANEICPSNLNQSYNPNFWGRLDGTVDNGEMRNVGDAFDATFQNTIFRHSSNAEGRTVLSPAVSEHLPIESVLVGMPVTNGRVLFDVPLLDIGSTAALGRGLHLSGSCEPQLLSSSVIDKRSFQFSFLPTKPGTAIFRIDEMWATAANSQAYLDGNQMPEGTDHVGPNADDFIWEIECVVPDISEPHTTEEPTELGFRLIDGGDCSGALDQFRIALEQDNKNDKAHYGRALVAECQGDIDKAESAYISFLENHPEQDELRAIANDRVFALRQLQSDAENSSSDDESFGIVDLTAAHTNPGVSSTIYLSFKGPVGTKYVVTLEGPSEQISTATGLIDESGFVLLTWTVQQRGGYAVTLDDGEGTQIGEIVLV